MKTITKIAIISCLTFGQLMVAQNQVSLQELLNRLKENHMGSITQVFTSEEISRLEDHFNSSVLFEESRFPGNKLIHATENTKQNYVEINPASTSSIQVVAPSPLAEFEGAGATVPDSKDAIVVDNMNNFYRVMPDGQYETVGQINPAAGLSFTGLEYTSDGKLYGIATDGAGDTRLYEINLSTQNAIPVGSSNGLVVGIALGRDMNNNLYSYDIDTNLVSRIDRVTGMAMMLGPIGFNANFGQGMGYDDNNDQLLITAFNGGTFKPELRSVNTTTGASTLISTIVPAQTLQFAWMSMFDPTLGVSDNLSIEFSIYPNPAQDLLNISSETIVDTVEIYSVLGQQLMHQTIESRTAALDVSNLHSGLYIIQLTTGEVKTALRFIKK